MNRLLTLIMALFLTSVLIAQEPAAIQLPNDTLKLGALKIIKINGEVKKNWADIIKNFDYYYIFRLPNVVGKTSNNFTLINNLIYKLRNNKKIVAYFGATRNIIDIKDVVSIIDLILKTDLNKNKIINIANKYNNKIIDIISYLSTMFKSQSFIVSKKYLIKSSYIINVNYIKKYINLLNIKFHKNYYKNVLNKYYVTKN